jgi:hypothetical protein
MRGDSLRFDPEPRPILAFQSRRLLLISEPAPFSALHGSPVVEAWEACLSVAVFSSYDVCYTS